MTRKKAFKKLMKYKKAFYKIEQEYYKKWQNYESLLKSACNSQELKKTETELTIKGIQFSKAWDRYKKASLNYHRGYIL